VGLPVQINTTFSRSNYDDFASIAGLLKSKKIALWSVFFLVPTGRGKLGDLLTDDDFEHIFAKLYRLSQAASFHIKTTEAQHYRRYVLQQEVLRKKTKQPASRCVEREEDTIGRAPRGLNDGKSFVFISHTGDVYPSGFLPVAGGNIRLQSLSSIYCESAVFRTLRTPDELGGKCGACEFRHVCGGSRARAYAVTGEPMAEEPCCSYVPKGYTAPRTALISSAASLQVL
jgi:radical SAM protein with 4Fe4S-binding SPASM domain